MTVTELKARLPALLDEIEGGDEIEITRHGNTVEAAHPGPPPACPQWPLRGRGYECGLLMAVWQKSTAQAVDLAGCESSKS